MSGESSQHHNDQRPSTSQQYTDTPQSNEGFYAESSEEEDSTRRKRRARVRRGPHQQGDPPPKRGRPTANPCWAHFARLESRLVRCRHCNKVVKSACATNMTKHLERHHRALLMMSSGGGEGLSASGPSVSVSGSDQQQQGSSYLDYSTDDTSHHHGLLDQQQSHPSVIVHAPPAVDQKTLLDVDASIAQSWGSHSILGSMDGSPSKTHPQMCGGEDVAIGLGPASWASGGAGAGSSLQVDLASSAAASWDVARPAAKRNRRTKHPVWELFRRTTSGQAQCQLCNAFVRSPCSSNFMGHLNRHHAEHYQDVYNRWLSGRRPCSVSESHVTSTTTPTGAGYSPQSNSGGTPSTPSGAAPTSSGGLLAPSTSAFNETFSSFDYSSGLPAYGSSSSGPHFNMVPPSLNCGLDITQMAQPSAMSYSGLDLFHYAQPPQQLQMNLQDQSLVRPPIFVDHTMHAMHPAPHHDVHSQMPHPDQFGYGPPHPGMGHPHDQR